MQSGLGAWTGGGADERRGVVHAGRAGARALPVLTAATGGLLLVLAAVGQVRPGDEGELSAMAGAMLLLALILAWLTWRARASIGPDAQLHVTVVRRRGVDLGRLREVRMAPDRLGPQVQQV